ncbi:MAG: phage tail sheath family protein, partial [Planctomycetota bacterium]|nr:phage tail sheath family protein [Planctomycetota bacterium]
TIRKALLSNTEWVAFEPQTNCTRMAVIRSVASYLSGLWRLGALAGGAPEESFYVRCDETTMGRDAGRLIFEVGVAPVRPMEFIVLRIEHRLDGGLAPTEGEEANLAR